MQAKEIEEVLQRRFFYRPSFELYGALPGLVDYGPLGCLMHKAMTALWHQRFVSEERALEIDPVHVVPEGTFHDPRPDAFNTVIGPTGKNPAILRPDTGHGHILNFKNLLAANNGHIPFTSASAGRCFVRTAPVAEDISEFTVVETYYFFDPTSKSHPRIGEVSNLLVDLIIPDGSQKAMAISTALSQMILPDEITAYQIAKVHLYLLELGFRKPVFAQRDGRFQTFVASVAEIATLQVRYHTHFIPTSGHTSRKVSPVNVTRVRRSALPSRIGETMI